MHTFQNLMQDDLNYLKADPSAYLMVAEDLDNCGFDASKTYNIDVSLIDPRNNNYVAFRP